MTGAEVRIVAATNRNPEAAVSVGRLRADLYYRLDVIRLHVPPLRERRADIALLARHFVSVHAARNGRALRGIDPDALAALERHAWPGNVRELENAMERAAILAREDTVRVADLPPALRTAVHAVSEPERLTFAPGTPLPLVERRMIEATLRQCNGDRALAAHLLGITARTIYRREAEWRDEDR